MKQALGRLTPAFATLGVLTLPGMLLISGCGKERAVAANTRETVLTEGTAVRTGLESRAELTFTDQTLARLGANTVFSLVMMHGERNAS
jgi:hypothetical protein